MWELESEALDLPLAQRVISVIAARYRVTPSEIYGRSRKRQIAQVRQLAMYFVAKHFGMRPDRVGSMFNRDRSTADYGCRKIADLLQKSEGAQQRLRDLEIECMSLGLLPADGGEDDGEEEDGEAARSEERPDVRADG